jgi:ABC-type glycerol-3-phosphate transport system permease component
MGVAFWQYIGFVTLLLLAGMQQISEDLYEAATLDGAGPLTCFWHLTIPLLRNALIIRGLVRYVGNSLIVTGFSIVLTIVVGCLAAYALARMKFVGRKIIYGIVIAAYAIPLHGILVPLYDTIIEFHLTNSYFGLILPYVTFGLPFAITVLYAFFLDFPGEIVEAARLDGCSELGVLWRIVVPLSMSAVASVAIFQGVQIWNEFLLALVVISDDALKTVPLGLVAFRGNYVSDWTAILASISVTSIPMLILFYPLPETIYPQAGRVDQITSDAFHATQFRSLDVKNEERTTMGLPRERADCVKRNPACASGL